jgi:hypothetical protein
MSAQIVALPDHGGDRRMRLIVRILREEIRRDPGRQLPANQEFDRVTERMRALAPSGPEIALAFSKLWGQP